MRYRTRRTPSRRSGRTSAGGTRYGMPASRIFRLARTRRWASVASGSRNPRAISGVVSPPSVRSVRATRASGASAGWQQVKISRSRSSMPSVVSSSPAALPSVVSVSRRSSSVFSASRRRRRTRSIAAFRAVVVIHAPGFRGTPWVGQTSTARANASWTASSARSKSPRTRIRVATARPDSSRKTRSAAAWASAAVKRSRGGRLARGEVDDRSDLDRAPLRTGARAAQGESLVEILRLDQVEAAKGLLRLGKRAIGRHRLPVANANRGRHRRGLERFAGNERAPVPKHLAVRVVLLHHGADLRGIRGAGRLLAVDEDEVLHRFSSVSRRHSPPLTRTTNGLRPNRHTSSRSGDENARAPRGRIGRPR